jgi:RHS repeat-associated protein
LLELSETAGNASPFGMGMPERKWGSSYRYGFNRKELDIDGNVVQYDYGFRIYDSRLSRFKSVDPITKSYPMLTPYQFASNRPIDGIDLDGLEYATFRIYVDKQQKVTKIEVEKDYELKNNGSEGPGVKYIIYRSDESNRPDEVRWSKNMYGIYQGGDNPKLPKIGGNYKKLFYDYSLSPINETDANAKQHDIDFDNIPPSGLEGLNGVLDERSTKANEDYIKRAEKTIEKQKKGEKDDITGKPVTKEAAKAAKFGKRAFRFTEDSKKAARLKQK